MTGSGQKPQRRAVRPQRGAPQQAVLLMGDLACVQARKGVTGSRADLARLVKDAGASGDVTLITPFEYSVSSSVKDAPGGLSAHVPTVQGGRTLLLSATLDEASWADLSQELRRVNLRARAALPLVAALALSVPGDALLIARYGRREELAVQKPHPEATTFRVDPDSSDELLAHTLDGLYSLREEGGPFTLAYLNVPDDVVADASSAAGVSALTLSPEQLCRAALSESGYGLGALRVTLGASQRDRSWLAPVAAALVMGVTSAALALVTNGERAHARDLDARTQALAPVVSQVNALTADNDRLASQLATTMTLAARRGPLAADLRAVTGKLALEQFPARLLTLSGPSAPGDPLLFDTRAPMTVYSATLSSRSRAEAERFIAAFARGSTRASVQNLSCTDAGCTLSALIGVLAPLPPAAPQGQPQGAAATSTPSSGTSGGQP